MPARLSDGRSQLQPLTPIAVSVGHAELYGYVTGTDVR